MKLTLFDNKVTDQRLLISTIRNAKEVEPITVNANSMAYYIDCDPMSIRRIEDALSSWTSLGLSTITWTLADNTTVELTQLELQELLNNTILARACRAEQLHDYSSTQKALLPVADDHTMFDEDTWPAF